MSADNSLKNFAELRSHWTEGHKLLEEFLIFIKEKAELDRAYGLGLEKISKLGLFDINISSLVLSLSALKTSTIDISTYFLSHSMYLEDDLYLKIKNTITCHDLSLKTLKEKIKKLFFHREKLIKKHLSTREKY